MCLVVLTYCVFLTELKYTDKLKIYKNDSKVSKGEYFYTGGNLFDVE